MRHAWTCIGVAILLAGCASEPPVLGGSTPAYLGITPSNASEWELPPPDGLRISPSKVLSANVFERVTGHDVDPARLVDR